jgi:hypothetical protein
MTKQQIKKANPVISSSHFASENNNGLKTRSTTPSTSAQLFHKRSHSIIINRTSTKPAQAFIPTPPALTPASTSATLTNKEDNYELPSSTAPAALGRRRTTNKVNSQQDWRALLIPKKRGGKK